MLPSPTRIEYAAPRAGAAGRRPIALLPAALAVEMMSIWMTSGLTLATQALRLAPAGLAPGGGPRRIRRRRSRIPSGPERGSYRISSPPLIESSSPVM